MQTDEVVTLILDKLGWWSEDLVKKSRVNSPAITKEQLIAAIYLKDTYHPICEYLGISMQTLHRILKEYLVPLFGNRNGGNDTWKLCLLTLAGIKYCGNCGELLPHSHFNKDAHTFDKLMRVCIDCKRTINTEFYSDNKDAYHKRYYKENYQEYICRNALRRAQKFKATPTWANRSKMLAIYKSRGKDEHVDHIVPLVHPLVCGLHNEFNLQVLSARENLQKSNKFEV